MNGSRRRDEQIAYMGSPYDQTMNSGQGLDLYGRTDLYPSSPLGSSGRLRSPSRSVGSGGSVRSSPSGRDGVNNPSMVDRREYVVPGNTGTKSSSPGGGQPLPDGTPTFNRPRLQTPSSGPYAGGEEMYQLERGPSPSDTMFARYRDTIPPQSHARFVSPRSPMQMPSSSITTSPLPPPPSSEGGPPLSMKSGAVAAALVQQQRRTASQSGTIPLSPGLSVFIFGIANPSS